MRHASIPAFLAIDVEPDGFQLSENESGSWDGFEAMHPFIESLREALATRSGTQVRFGWYFRTDPQIAFAYGRPDHALRYYAQQIKLYRGHGDYLGVHVHPLRWCDERDSWVHDFANPRWLKETIRSSFDVFAEWTGARALHSRFGAGFLNNDVIAATEESGATIDLTLEPVSGWGLRSTVVPTSIDSSPIIGAFLDCSEAPREPYSPAGEDFRRRAAPFTRPLTLVPLSSVVSSGLDCGSVAVQMLYPSVSWPSPNAFWDLCLRQIESMDRPYLSLAIRTDAQDMAISSRVRKVFEALPSHPISEILHWVDPLEALSGLLAA